MLAAATGEGTSRDSYGTGGGESHGTAHARRPSRARVKAGGGHRFSGMVRGPGPGPG